MDNLLLNHQSTRRAFLGTAAAATLTAAAPGNGWVDLFDGHSLNGWQPSEHKDSWKIVGNMLKADGPRSHLFYNGQVNGADFKNFELEVELTTQPDCNSGVYFHTTYQESGFPDKGFEVQVNNTAHGDGGYLERKKTASLYGLRNMYKQLVPDEKPFRINIAVRGKNVQIHLNGIMTVDYVEPTPAVIPAGGEAGRFLSQGTFALQCHNNGSRAAYHSVRVRPLPGNLPAYTAEHPRPLADQPFRQVIDLGRHNLPIVDYHVNLPSGMTVDAALRKSRADGIMYGITHLPLNDTGAQRFLQSLESKPLFFGLASSPGSLKQISRDTARNFDYVIASGAGDIDALAAEPIDVYSFSSAPPDEPGSRQKLIGALANNKIAIELNTTHQWPNRQFVEIARDADCKFAFGTGNQSASELKRCESGLNMVEACKLDWKSFFLPGSWYPKAVERKWVS